MKYGVVTYISPPNPVGSKKMEILWWMMTILKIGKMWYFQDHSADFDEILRTGIHQYANFITKWHYRPERPFENLEF